MKRILCLPLLLAASCGQPNPNPMLGIPGPRLTFLASDTVPVGDTPLEVALSGSGFIPASVVRWNGDPRPTRFLSERRLEFTLSAADRAVGSLGWVTVLNPGPSGGVSQAAALMIRNPVPSLARLSVDTATTGRGELILEVDGAGFVASSELLWRGNRRPAMVAGRTRLAVRLADTLFLDPAVAEVRVWSPPPGGGMSDPLQFVIRAAATAASP